MILLSVVLLSASSAFAADVDDGAIAVSDEIAVDDVLASEEADALEVAEDNALAASAVVTNATFHNYFDDGGNLNDSVTADELVFDGDFSGIDVNYLVVNKAIKLTGNGAKFNDVAFVIVADNVTVDGFDITHDADIQAVSILEAKNVVLSNNKINFASLVDNDGYAIDAQAVDNLKLLNNTITFVGNTTGSNFNSALRVTGDESEMKSASNVLIDGNTFNVAVPSVELGYMNYPATDYYSTGVLCYFCENLTFTNNKVDLKYNTFDLGWYGSDSVYALSLSSGPYDFDDDYEIIYPYMSKNVFITGNEFNVLGHTYAYGVLIGGNDVVFNENIVNVTSDTKYANAVSVCDPSANVYVVSNIINTKAPEVTYNIYGYQYMGALDNLSFINNLINSDSYYTCGFELVVNNALISDNVVVLKGNHTTGIVADVIVNGTIDNNVISSFGTNVGDNGTGDSYLHKESVAINVNGNVAITNNELTSTAIGVNLDDKGNGGEVLLDNNTIYVDVEGDTDNYAIFAKSMDALNITNNKILFIGKSNGTAMSNAIYVEGIDGAVISNNDLDVVMPAGAGSAIEVASSEDIILSENEINFTYNGTVGWGSTNVIAVGFGCDNPVISNNYILALGGEYIYGINTYAQNFTIDGNILAVESDVNYACGINPDGGASGVVNNNSITVIAPKSVYGIYSGMWYASSPLVVNYTNNNIEGSSFFACGIEIGGAKEEVIANDINLKGNYTMGVALYKYAQDTIDTTIKDNVIEANGNNIGDASIVWDSVGVETTGIKLKAGNVTVSGNDVKTTGDYAVVVDGAKGTVENNTLVANNIGKNAINVVSDVKISGTGPDYKTIIVAADLTKAYGAAGQYVVTVLDENGNAIANKTITATINGGELKATTDANGVAKFNMDLTVGSYDVKAAFAGDKVYGPKDTTNKVVITKAATKFTAPSKAYKAKAKVKKYVIALKANGKGVAKVKVVLKIKNKKYVAYTNANGKALFKITKLTKKGKYAAVVAFAGNGLYKASSAKAKIVLK